MKKIPVGNGHFALVDDEDYELVGQRRWHLNNRGYIKSGKVLLHRLVTSAPPGYDVDHIDGDKMDNRRSNLRVCTRGQNLANQKRSANNTSGYKGVTFNKECNRWQAYIHQDGRQYHLGLFHDIVDAARAYDAAAQEKFGEFARPNFPKP